MKFTQTDYTSAPEILLFADHYVAMGCTLSDTGVAVDSTGRKIVKKGTFVGGSSASVFADRTQKLKVAHDYAALETAMTGDNNDIKLTAKDDGTGGAAISLTLVDPAANSKDLAVSVVGKGISVSLATGAAGAITTTASELIAAINADEAAAALVTASLKGTDTGAGVVTALAKTSLANGGLTGPTVIDGVLLNDVDVTSGSAPCALLIHGFVNVAKIPGRPTAAMKTAFATGLQLAFIG